MDRRTVLQLAGGAAVLPWLGGLASAQVNKDVLKVALAAAPGALDPHFHNSLPNNQTAASIFDALTAFDERQSLVPALATAWRTVAPKTWEFTLRPGVVFSDGAPLTIEDIVASFERVATLPTPLPFTIYTRSIAKIELGDPGKVLIHTKDPDPLLPSSATRVRIIKASSKDLPTSDFNRGVGTIGTGPYTFKEYAIGSRLVLGRNERYWGPKQPWGEIVVSFITDKAARTAALMSRSVDLIDVVAPSDIADLRKNSSISIVSVISNRLVFFAMDQYRDVSTFITDKNGAPFAKNPMKDLRVRQALSHAINREGISTRIMDGQSVPAAQFVPFETSFGSDSTLKPASYDPEMSKRLLTEAGYAGGFKLVMHSSSDRYLNDSGIAQAVAQMLTRIGIQTSLEVMPWTVYSKRMNDREFSFCLDSWGANTGEAGTPMLATVATPAKSAGQSNSGHYSNSEIDSLLREALSTMDDAHRASLLAKISRMAIDDVAIIPLHFEKTTWAHSNEIAFKGRSDQYSLLSNAGKA